MPTAPRQWGSALQEVRCPLPPGSEVVYCRRSTAHCPQAVRQCKAGVPLRECTGPAMPQHTYTQRAHNTHSPARLPVPVGRHPGLCLLVTAPSAHHTTPHHTTRCARFYVPTGPAGRSDHPLGRTPHPPRPVGPLVHPRRPCRKLRPPPGLDSPSPQAGVPGSTSPQALQDTPTTP